MKNLTWQNPEQLFVAQELINKVKSKCCGIKDEVRTRKILSISNSLASAGNIAYAIGTEDWRKLDVGGILVTLYRLFTDVRFITKVKKDFIETEMDKSLADEIKELDSYFK